MRAVEGGIESSLFRTFLDDSVHRPPRDTGIECAVGPYAPEQVTVTYATAHELGRQRLSRLAEKGYVVSGTLLVGFAGADAEDITTLGASQVVALQARQFRTASATRGKAHQQDRSVPQPRQAVVTGHEQGVEEVCGDGRFLARRFRGAGMLQASQQKLDARITSGRDDTLFGMGDGK